MKRSSAVLVSLLLWSSSAWTQTPEFASTTAEVVAWNFAGFQAIPLARQAQLARVLSDLDAEVVAAVEVNPDNVVHDLAAALTEDGTCYDALILDQTATQNIGVIFKCEVQVTNPRLIADSDDGNSGLRKALAVDVRMGQFDFLMVVVHLKAGRNISDGPLATGRCRTLPPLLRVPRAAGSEMCSWSGTTT